MIITKDLSVKYVNHGKKTLALDKINISMDTGDIYTFIGPSGCGKSTLLHVLAGIVTDFEGTVLINDRSVDPRRQRIGLILQNYGLLPWKNVYQNIMLGRKIKRDRIWLDEYSSYILKELNIDEILHRYPREISGGQQQRVAIARAFILQPDLLLMDEPFSALDAITREDMQALFLDIWKQHSVTTVFITHSVDEALYLGSKIVVFSPAPGRIIELADNPCFQLEDLRRRDEYQQMSLHIRELLDQGRSLDINKG